MLPNTSRDSTPVPTPNGPLAEFPPGEDGVLRPPNDLFTAARQAGIPDGAKGGEQTVDPLEAKMLRLVTTAETSSDNYMNFVRKSWDRAQKAHQNKHFAGSKYTSKDWRSRSTVFRPKTRTAVRKGQAAVAASLFSTVDAIAIGPGNEGDDRNRASAALLQEVVNYRTDRTSGRNAIPWFLTTMGAYQDAQLTGICGSKQYWKLQTKQVGEQTVMQTDPATGQEGELWEKLEDGTERPVKEPILKTVFDRPDCLGIAPENIIIDSGADWTDPAQSAAFLIIRWPMKLHDIRQREKDPRDPWRALSDSILRAGQVDRAVANAQAVRNAREGGQDRYDRTNQSDEFATIWVYEVYVRADGEDYTFFSIKDQALLTKPRPVEEVYPWNDGERPIIIGYGSLEAHKIFPMAPAESWQQLQIEANDLANLTLDTLKQNIAPIALVTRGRQVELDKLRARAPGTNILVQSPDDIHFEKPPGPDGQTWQMQDRINADFDDLAGQFNAGSVGTNRQLNETVGGMRLISGAANAMGEFDQRVFIETWAERALGQIVKLCQYYEHDQTVLGLCGERAKLWEKFKVDAITDEMLDDQITVRIDVGVGAGDPQQRLAKFQMAAAAAMALLKDHPKFQSGELEVDAEAVIQECFGGAGYRDGGKRFIKKNPPPQPSMKDQLAIADAQATIEQKRSAAQLNLTKSGSEATKARLSVMELISDLLGGQQERGDRIASEQQDRQDKHLEQAQGEHARQQDRSDARETRDADHQLARDTAMIKAGGKPPARKLPDQDHEPHGGGQQHVQLIRGKDRSLTGMRLADGRTVQFQRGHDGAIAGLSITGGAQPQAAPQIEMPPAHIAALAGMHA